MAQIFCPQGVGQRKQAGSFGETFGFDCPVKRWRAAKPPPAERGRARSEQL